MSALISTASTMLLTLAGSAIAAAAIAGTTGALAPVMAASLGASLSWGSPPPTAPATPERTHESAPGEEQVG